MISFLNVVLTAVEGAWQTNPAAVLFFAAMAILALVWLFPVAKEAADEALADVKEEILQERYAPIVAAAKARFPEWRVWGEEIFNGKGYGVNVSDGISKSMIQVLSEIVIDGQPKKVDFMDESAQTRAEMLDQAFTVVDKNLRERTARVLADESKKTVAQQAGNGQQRSG